MVFVSVFINIILIFLKIETTIIFLICNTERSNIDILEIMHVYINVLQLKKTIKNIYCKISFLNII